MIHFSEWLESRSDNRFLVMGKGPSFSHRADVELDGYTTVSLNHVVREQPVDVAHFIDMDALADCEAALAANADYLLMPRHPHVAHCASALSLDDFINTVPMLAEFEAEGRLLFYDLFTATAPAGKPFDARGTFSGSVVVDLLVRLGVTHVDLLGIDGGQYYAPDFSDLHQRTLLANGHGNFDVQLAEIERSAAQHNANVRQLIEPVRVFIGCDDTTMIPSRVLEYTIRKHASTRVEVTHMRNQVVRTPSDPASAPGTAFSFNRFAIPQLCQYQGKAIYLDSDMLVFDDIRKLWNLPTQDFAVLCSTQQQAPQQWLNAASRPIAGWSPGRQLSVMLIECDRVDWQVDRIVDELDEHLYTYRELMTELCITPESQIGDTIPNAWNCLEWYKPGESCLLHYTNVTTQPWRNNRNPLTNLWEEALIEACQTGFVDKQDVLDAISAGDIKPDIEARLTFPDSDQKPATESAETKHADVQALREQLWHYMAANAASQDELLRLRQYPSVRFEEHVVRPVIRFALRVMRGVKHRLRTRLLPGAGT